MALQHRREEFWQHLVKTERDTLKFRFLAVLVVAVSTLLRQDAAPLSATLGLIFGYLAYTIGLNQALRRGLRADAYVLLGFMMAVDTTAVLAAPALIGPDSPAFILVPMVIVYHALYLGYVGSLTTATIASLGYAILAQTVFPNANIRDLVSIQIPLFFIAALLTGYLATQRTRERQEKLALQRLIETEALAREMLEMTSAILKSLDPRAVANDLARLGAATAGAPLCAIFHTDPQSRSLELLGSNFPLDSGRNNGDGEGAFREPLQGETPGARAVRAGKGSVVWNPGDARPLPDWAIRANAQSVLALPLPSPNGDPVGALYVLDTAADSPATERAKELERFTQAAGDLIQRLRLFPQAEERGTQMLSRLRQSVARLGRFRELQERRSIRLGPLVLDPAHERATMGDDELSLGRAEFDVLYLLAENAGQVVSPETLRHEVWKEEEQPKGNAVDVCVHRLRRKLAKSPYGGNIIRTVRGRGYLLETPRA